MKEFLKNIKADAGRWLPPDKEAGPREILRLLAWSKPFKVVLSYRLRHRLVEKGRPRSERVVRALTGFYTDVDLDARADIGPGLKIVHASDIVIGGGARAGRDLTLLNGTTLGQKDRGEPFDGTWPVLGDEVTLGAGAKILGPVKIGDKARVGANSVVLKDAPAGAVVVGVPGRIVGKANDE